MNTQLPEPHGWNNRYPLFGSILAIAALGGMFFAVKAVVAAAHGHWAAAIVAAASTMVFGIPTVWIVLMFTRRGRLRASVDHDGTSLALAAGIRWLTVWFGAVLVAVVGYLVFGAQMGGEFPDVRARSAAFFAVMVVGAVLGLGATVRAGRRPRPGLRLSSAGVEFTTRSRRSHCSGRILSTSPAPAWKERTCAPSSFGREVAGPRSSPTRACMPRTGRHCSG